jgi:DNA-3-methyladenine glycosylase II
MKPHYWKKAQTHLCKQCPTMAGLIARYEGEGLAARGEGFYTLIRAIVGQQISVKAADAVWAKLAKAVTPMTPENLLRKREATLRACGLSASKVAYARNVAQFFKERDITARYWDALSDDDVIRELTSIKGIGSWTAEMFLIFHLLRPDVLPLKDLGLLKAIDLHYTGGKRLTVKEYQAISARWQPYRTVATWYLWRALDPVPVAY